MNKNKKNLMKELEYEYFLNRKKFIRSKTILIFLNLSMFIMSAIIVIMTLIVIGKQIGGHNVQIIFVAISIITSVIAFLFGISTLFRFKNQKNDYLKRTQKLEEIKNYFHYKYEKYKDIDHTVIRVSEKIDELDEQ